MRQARKKEFMSKFRHYLQLYYVQVVLSTTVVAASAVAMNWDTLFAWLLILGYQTRFFVLPPLPRPYVPPVPEEKE